MPLEKPAIAPSHVPPSLAQALSASTQSAVTEIRFWAKDDGWPAVYVDALLELFALATGDSPQRPAAEAILKWLQDESDLPSPASADAELFFELDLAQRDAALKLFFAVRKSRLLARKPVAAAYQRVLEARAPVESPLPAPEVRRPV